ncbi:hypothetical protein [Streptomyces syringium]|uniref:hypothetical protein n=1 Tax=Streptomyces syringium TaxID=76729 RepID=UPI00345690DE
MRTDRRRIQTAVLGGADSDDPLMLPMEAIELDAFRRRYVRSAQAEVSRACGRSAPLQPGAVRGLFDATSFRDRQPGQWQVAAVDG